MAAMIDYAVLCRAIEDWKAGHAPRVSVTPSRPPPPRPSSPSAETVVEGYEAVEESVEEAVDEAVEPVHEQAPEDRTIIYQMPEIVDEGEEI